MKWFLSIKTKIILSFIGLVLLLGGFTGWLVYKQMSDNMREHLTGEGERVAQAMAESGRHLILTENTIRLQKMIDSLKISDKNIRYIYVSDRYNNPVVHTFKKNIPVDLVNLISPSLSIKPQHFYLEAGGDAIRHMTVPIDEGKVGFISIGLTETYLKQKTRVMLKRLILIALLCLGAVLVGMYFLTSIITRSLGQLTRVTRQVGQGNFNVWVEIKTRDEINELGLAFNKMSADLKEYIRRLNESERNLSRSRQMAAVGQMCAALAHEINNPLDGIQRSINVIKNTCSEKEINKTLFGLISEGLKRIEHTVRQLLIYARYQPEFSEVNLNSIIEKVFKLTEQRIKENEIGVTFQLNQEIPSFRADPNGLSQVISNLLANSLDVLKKKGMITVQTKLIAPDPARLQPDKSVLAGRHSGGQVEIFFLDSGPGIPDEIKDKIFDPFFSTKEKTKGTGLGLAITKNIIEQHGGSIRVESRAGQGSSFIILLPINSV
ncbi:MAG: ATP-binding protein [Planctomycetota bacterium]